MMRSTRFLSVSQTRMMSTSSAGLTLELDPQKLASSLEGKQFINGEFVARSKTFEVLNPATQKPIAVAADGGQEDVNVAVDNAHEAYSSWKSLTGRQRGDMVRRVGEALDEHKEELARLTSLETGKAFRTESLVEAGVVGDTFKFYGGLGGELKGMSIPWSNDSLTYTVQEPYGVVGAIVPFNVPLMLMGLKIAPALVAGNTVVVKSPEEAPLGVLRIAEIASKFLPPGVFNLISGDGPGTGAPLVEHPKVKKVTFTGSVETGRTIYKMAAEKLIPATLELGGKSPMIVNSDADLDAAIAGAVNGMRFTRAGQSCTAASRIFVHEDIHDKFLDGMITAVNAMKMGDPQDDATDMGTIISKAQFDKVHGYIKLGEETPGAVANVCNELPSDYPDGLFIRPVIFSNVDNDCRLSREEIFGPVCSLIKFNDFEDVLKQANDTEYGLAATVWTSDLKKALRGVEVLQAGIVQVNQNAVLQPNLPVAGAKKSGLGREGAMEDMINGFTKAKTISINRR